MPTYANRVASFGTTIFTEINNLANQHNAVNLGQGRPNFDTPPEVVEAAVEALRSGTQNQYAPGFGTPNMRNAIAEHSKRFYDWEVNPDGEVLVTAGATEGLFASMLGNVDAGQEVIVIEPFFDIYAQSIHLIGATPVYVPLSPPNWTLDPDALRAAFNENTRAIIVNSPNNPTGAMFSAEEMQLVAELCIQHDAICISDEVYEHIVFAPNTHTPMAQLPGMWERTLTVSSGGKSFSSTGWKVGWIIAPPDLLTGAWRAHQNLTFAVNHPSQEAIACALRLPDDYYTGLTEMYTSKRALMLQGLDAAGLPYFEPQGAFYIMADFSGVFDGDDAAFAKHLITEVGVASIPPSTFYSAAHKHIGEKFVRFAFCKTDDVLQAGVERLAKLRG